MANIDIKINEDNLVEKDGVLYRKDENGLLVKTGCDSLVLGFKRTDIYRAENIVQLRRDNSSGIDVDSVLNSFFKGAAGKMLDNLIIEEFLRLQVDITNIISEDEDFMRKTIFSIKQ